MNTACYIHNHDNIFFGRMSNQMVQHFVKQLQYEFEMSLGLQVKQMDDTIFIFQSKYAKSIVKKFCLENASHKRTPAATHVKLSKDEKGVEVDQNLYRRIQI